MVKTSGEGNVESVLMMVEKSEKNTLMETNYISAVRLFGINTSKYNHVELKEKVIIREGENKLI